MVYNGSDKHKQALFENKQDKLVAGDNISLTPQLDGTVEISAEGGGGTVTDVEVDGTSVVDENGVAQITMPSDFIGATSQQAGSHGLVPAPLVTDKDKFLKGDGTWGEAGGNVDDVQMNGVSIVDANKIAKFNNYIELTRSEYDALPDTKYTDNILYCIKDSGSEKAQFLAPIVYSLAEREVGVWCDGKPLYQKSYIFTDYALISGQNLIDIPILREIDIIVNSSVIMSNSAHTNFRTLNGYDLSVNHTNSLYYVLHKQVAESSLQYKLELFTSASWATPNIYVTIQYTKTTDNQGTGRWAQDGVPAVHYSTDEKVIGTWIDGSTLYEKTAILSYTDFVVQENVSNGRVYNLYNISGTNTQIVKVFPTALSTNYGVTSGLTQNNYDNSGSYWGLKMSYSALALYCSNGWTIINDHVKPTVYVTVQYTKSS